MSMADSGGSGGSMVGAPMGSPGMAFEPFFKMWSEWMTNNMGPMTTVPGASLPWLTKPGVTTGEETKPLPEGAMANDPLLSAIDKVWDANPLRNIVPLDWAEITRALRTLWMRELSNPQRAVTAVGGGRREGQLRSAFLRAGVGVQPLLRDAQGVVLPRYRVSP